MSQNTELIAEARLEAKDSGRWSSHEVALFDRLADALEAAEKSNARLQSRINRALERIERGSSYQMGTDVYQTLSGHNG